MVLILIAVPMTALARFGCYGMVSHGFVDTASRNLPVCNEDKTLLIVPELGLSQDEESLGIRDPGIVLPWRSRFCVPGHQKC